MHNIPPPTNMYQSQRKSAAPYSNTTKYYANWNICFSCGFDVDSWHTSQMCPYHW